MAIRQINNGEPFSVFQPNLATAEYPQMGIATTWNARLPGISRRSALWVLAGVLLFLGFIEWFYEQRKERRFDSDIVSAARQYNVDPALVKAVVWRESKFNPKVRGRVGEIGLMQIRTLAAEEWAQAQKRRAFEGNLFEPALNLHVGTWYLGKLLRRYARTDNPPAYALADYNAGRSNVLRWNQGSASTNSALFIAQISFPGTQAYVRAVLERSTRYEDLRRAHVR